LGQHQHAAERRVDRRDEQPVVAPRQAQRQGAAGIAAAAVGEPPFAPFGGASSSAALARLSRSGNSSRATSPVHPVWCAAPSPCPLSPWKYSKNGMLSRNSGRSKRLSAPNTGRRPDASRRKIAARRRASSSATSARLSMRPEPTGHSTRKSSP